MAGYDARTNIMTYVSVLDSTGDEVYTDNVGITTAALRALDPTTVITFTRPTIRLTKVADILGPNRMYSPQLDIIIDSGDSSDVVPLDRATASIIGLDDEDYDVTVREVSVPVAQMLTFIDELEIDEAANIQLSLRRRTNLDYQGCPTLVAGEGTVEALIVGLFQLFRATIDNQGGGGGTIVVNGGGGGGPDTNTTYTLSSNATGISITGSDGASSSVLWAAIAAAVGPLIETDDGMGADLSNLGFTIETEDDAGNVELNLVVRDTSDNSTLATINLLDSGDSDIVPSLQEKGGVNVTRLNIKSGVVNKDNLNTSLRGEIDKTEAIDTVNVGDNGATVQVLNGLEIGQVARGGSDLAAAVADTDNLVVEVLINRSDINRNRGIGTPWHIPVARIGPFTSGNPDFNTLVAMTVEALTTSTDGSGDMASCEYIPETSRRAKCFVVLSPESSARSNSFGRISLCQRSGNSYGNSSHSRAILWVVSQTGQLSYDGWDTELATYEVFKANWNANPTVDNVPSGSVDISAATRQRIDDHYDDVTSTNVRMPLISTGVKYDLSDEYLITDEIQGVEAQVSTNKASINHALDEVRTKQPLIMRGEANPNTALLVAPGGSEYLRLDSDGNEIERWLNDQGGDNSTWHILERLRALEGTGNPNGDEITLPAIPLRLTGTTSAFIFSNSANIVRGPDDFAVPNPARNISVQLSGSEVTYALMELTLGSGVFLWLSSSFGPSQAPATITLTDSQGNDVVLSRGSDPVLTPSITTTPNMTLVGMFAIGYTAVGTIDPTEGYTISASSADITIENLSDTLPAVQAPKGERYIQKNNNGDITFEWVNDGVYLIPLWRQLLNAAVSSTVAALASTNATKITALSNGVRRTEDDGAGFGDGSLKRESLEQSVQNDIANAGGVREDLDIYYLFNPQTEVDPYSHTTHFPKPAGNILGYIGNFAYVGGRTLARHHGGEVRMRATDTARTNLHGVLIFHEYDHGTNGALAIELAIDRGSVPLADIPVPVSLELREVGGITKTFTADGIDHNAAHRMQRYDSDGADVGSEGVAAVFQFRGDGNFLSRSGLLQGLSHIAINGTDENGDPTVIGSVPFEANTPKLIANQGVRAHISNHSTLLYERSYRVDPSNTDPNRWVVEDTKTTSGGGGGSTGSTPLILERIPIAHDADPDAVKPTATLNLSESSPSAGSFAVLLPSEGVTTARDIRTSSVGSFRYSLLGSDTLPEPGFRVVDTESNDAIIRSGVIIRQANDGTRLIYLVVRAETTDPAAFPESITIIIGEGSAPQTFNRGANLPDATTANLGGGIGPTSVVIYNQAAAGSGRLDNRPEITLTTGGPASRFQIQTFANPQPALTGLPNQLAIVIDPDADDDEENKALSRWYYNNLTGFWVQIDNYEDYLASTLVTSAPPADIGGTAAFGYAITPEGETNNPTGSPSLYSRAGLSVSQYFRKSGETDRYTVLNLGDNILRIANSRGSTRTGAVILELENETDPNLYPIFVTGTQGLTAYPRSYGVVADGLTYIYERVSTDTYQLLNSDDSVHASVITACFYRRTVGDSIPNDARISDFFIVRPAESSSPLQFHFTKPTGEAITGHTNQLALETNRFDRHIVENIWRNTDGEIDWQRLQLHTPEIQNILASLGIGDFPLGVTNSFPSDATHAPVGVTDEYWLAADGNVRRLNSATNLGIELTPGSGDVLAGLTTTVLGSTVFFATAEQPNVAGIGINFTVLTERISVVALQAGLPATEAVVESADVPYDITAAELQNGVRPVPGLAFVNDGTDGDERGLVALVTKQEGNIREYLLWNWSLAATGAITTKDPVTTRTMIPVGNSGNIEAMDIKLFRNSSMVSDADPIEHLFALIIEDGHYIIRAYPLTITSGVRSLDRDTSFEVGTLRWSGAVTPGNARGLDIVPGTNASVIQGANVCIGNSTYTFGGEGALQVANRLARGERINLYADSDALDGASSSDWNANIINLNASAPALNELRDSDRVEFIFNGFRGRKIPCSVSGYLLKSNRFREADANVDAGVGPLQNVIAIKLHRSVAADRATSWGHTTIYITQPPGTDRTLEIWGDHAELITEEGLEINLFR